jgi:phosphohistidine phosphatase SixA
MLIRSLLVALPLCLAAMFGPPAAAAEATEADAAAWAALQAGGKIVFIRHAATDPGIGDPPGFLLADCRTQRNLSARGRADAGRLGAAFRARAVPVHAVLSSRWCRCLDTAKIAFGKADAAPMLDSTFGQADPGREPKERAVFDVAGRHAAPGNLVMVSHAQNIQELTGVSPSAGEVVVATIDGPNRFKVVARLQVPGE